MSEDITTQFVLQSDVVPTRCRSAMIAREQLGADEGAYALSRTMSRSPVRVLDRDFADLLERFRSPTRIVDAILSYSRDHRIGAEATLEEAFPILQRLIDSQVLVVATSERPRQLSPG